MRKFALLSVFAIVLAMFATLVSANPVWDAANFTSSKSVAEGSALNIDYSATLNDSGSLAFTLQNAPSGATLTKLSDTVARFSWTPTFKQAGVYDIKLNVSDSNSSDAKTLTVTVVDTANPSSTDPALSAISSQTVNEGKTLTINLVSTAPDNGALNTFTTNATFGSLVKNSDTSAIFTFAPTFVQAGVYSVKFTAADGDSSSSQEVVITVVDVPAGMSAHAELSLGSSAQRRSNPRADDRADREVNVSGTLTITNTGSEALSNLTLLSVAPKLGFSTNDLLISATFDKKSLSVGESATATVTARVPEKLDAVNSNLVPTAFEVASLTFSANSQTGGIITTNTAVKMQAENQLNIKDLDVSFDGDTEDVDDGDTVKDMKPGQHVKVVLEAENRFSNDDNVDIEDIEFTVDSDDLDVDEDDDMGSLGPKDTDTATIEFDLEKDAENGRQSVIVILEGRDENGARHGEKFTLDFEIERKSHEIMIDDLRFSPSTVACEKETELSVTLRNIGRDDEDDVTLNLESPELKYGTVINKIEIDEDDDITQRFVVPLKNLTAGNYRLTASAYYEFDQFSNRETVLLTVRECGSEAAQQAEPTITPPQIGREPEDTGIEVVPVEREPSPITEPVKEEASFFERPEYITLLVIGVVIALGLIIWLLISLSKKE